jgi:O-acetyl-ADP-ribose deacetylase (regulator of RNase III)
MTITHVIGDATQPLGEGPKIIVHVCNDIGGWGRGFVLALSKRWPTPELEYRAWFRGGTSALFELGEIQMVQVEQNLWVANLIGQRDVRTVRGIPPVRYEAIRKGLKKVAQEAHRLGATVHMPRIGCGLAGGEWQIVRSIIEEELCCESIQVTVYDLA